MYNLNYSVLTRCSLIIHSMKKKTIKNIIHRYIQLSEPNKPLRSVLIFFFFKSVIYYKHHGIATLPVQNNEFSCFPGDCISIINNQNTTLNSYIGHTYTTLSHRLTSRLSKFRATRSHLHQHNTNSQNINISVRKVWILGFILSHVFIYKIVDVIGLSTLLNLR